MHLSYIIWYKIYLLILYKSHIYITPDTSEYSKAVPVTRLISCTICSLLCLIQVLAYTIMGLIRASHVDSIPVQHIYCPCLSHVS